MKKPRASTLQQAYKLLIGHFGHQHWWPADTPFEVCVGAILTQNTNWGNVRRAINNLKAAQVLDARKLFALPGAKLAALIRPAGYFNVKAKRLRSFLQVLVEQYDADLDRLFAGDTALIRERLLAISGVGPETADSMLLYGGGHHSFVVDGYTKRIFHRHGWCEKDASYGDLQKILASASNKPVGERTPGLLAGLSCAIGRGGKPLLPFSSTALRPVPIETTFTEQK